MIPTDILITLGKGALVGGVIGYLTNALAVRMLFRPRRRWTLLGAPVPLTPGLVESNRERLAEAIGRSVGNDLLSLDLLVEEIREAGLHEPVAAWLDEERHQLLADERPLREALSTIDPALPTALEHALSRQLLQALQSLSTEESIAPILRDSAPALADLTAVDLLGEDGADRIASMLLAALAPLLDSSVGTKLSEELITHERINPVARAFESTASDYVSGRLPALAEAVQRALGEYLQSEGFAAAAQERLAPKLHRAVVDKFPMAKLVLSERAVGEMLRDHWEQIGSELEALATSQEVEQFLTAQLSLVGGNFVAAAGEALRDEAVLRRLRQELAATMAHPKAAEALRPALLGLLTPLLHRPIYQWLPGENPAALAPPLARAAKALLESERTALLLRRAIAAAIDRFLLAQPVRDLAKLLEGDAWQAVQTGLALNIERRALEKLPAVMESRLDIAGIVRRRIVNFDSAQVEETIRRVSGNELKGIVRLGGLIGIIVGALTALIDAYFLTG